MTREQAAEKLKKLKALAERGVGGEKETAMKLYRELMKKYQIEEAEVLEDRVTLHWFSYSDNLEEDLLTQVFFQGDWELELLPIQGKIQPQEEAGLRLHRA